MNFRNTKVILLILILGCESKLFLRFNSVKCGASLKSASDIYCYVKTYARKLSILNVGYTLLRRISEGLVGFFLLNFIDFLLKLRFLAHTDSRTQVQKWCVQNDLKLHWLPDLWNIPQWKRKLLHPNVHKYHAANCWWSGWELREIRRLQGLEHELHEHYNAEFVASGQLQGGVQVYWWNRQQHCEFDLRRNMPSMIHGSVIKIRTIQFFDCFF